MSSLLASLVNQGSANPVVVPVERHRDDLAIGFLSQFSNS